MNAADTELAIRAQTVLNSAVRPLLNIDAGDIEITSVEDGQVRLALIGSCGRCMFRSNCVHNLVVPTLMEALDLGVEAFRVRSLKIQPHALLLTDRRASLQGITS